MAVRDSSVFTRDRRTWDLGGVESLKNLCLEDYWINTYHPVSPGNPTTIPWQTRSIRAIDMAAARKKHEATSKIKSITTSNFDTDLEHLGYKEHLQGV
ncbi:hypothetical protein NL676_036416 [Syzygium grande]|nr:hypothetical protein NL676_036416 [Syzygium grande]